MLEIDGYLVVYTMQILSTFTIAQAVKKAHNKYNTAFFGKWYIIHCPFLFGSQYTVHTLTI